MSNRLDEARRALDAERQRRWATYHRDRTPDLFTGPADDWQTPASPSDEWKAAALAEVRRVAQAAVTFSVADVRIPETVDRRAIGSVLRQAARAGWIRSDGYIQAGPERHGRPVTRWRSLLIDSTE